MVNYLLPSRAAAAAAGISLCSAAGIPGSSNDDFVLTFSNNGKLNPPGTLSIKSAIVSSDSNTAAGNHSDYSSFQSRPS